MINISALTSSCSSSSSSSSSSSKKRPRSSTASSVSSSATTSSLSSAHSSSESFSKLSDDTIDLLRNIHPSEYAKAAFTANGFDDANQQSIAKQCETRFEAPTSEMLEAYGTEILMAVRNNDLPLAKSLFKDGKFNKGCNACNRFGESILHIACRRGHFDMVQFLVNDVGLSITTIRDDYHRTPLHDAFWTSTASYDVVDFLLNQPNVTELLLCKDRRGFTPLDYSRGEDRGKWLRFLWERKASLRPSPSTILATACCSVIAITEDENEQECSSTSTSTSTTTTTTQHEVEEDEDEDQSVCSETESPHKRQRIIA